MGAVVREGGQRREGAGADRWTERRILVVGGGFAGVWSALAAARFVSEERPDPHVRITLISADPYLTIRPRLYEPDLKDLRLPLDRLLTPAGVERMEALVTAIDPVAHTVTVDEDDEVRRLHYDRLVLAAGSQVARPPVPGLAQHAFDVDTYLSARRLQEHLASLRRRSGDPSLFSAVVIGAGFTGLEVATEFVGRLEAVAGGERVGVTLVESSTEVGRDLGPGPRPAILAALSCLGIRLRLGDPAVAIDASGVTRPRASVCRRSPRCGPGVCEPVTWPPTSVRAPIVWGGSPSMPGCGWAPATSSPPGTWPGRWPTPTIPHRCRASTRFPWAGSRATTLLPTCSGDRC